MLIVYKFEKYFISSIPGRKDFYANGSKLDEKNQLRELFKELDLSIPHRPEKEVGRNLAEYPPRTIALKE